MSKEYLRLLKTDMTNFENHNHVEEGETSNGF